uniref:Uncharacterized protein MANES_09G031800 n=1 Tax=Rhizophora mucronata TaxID=61149 RepID=A0A2P2LX06_RHIMU
MRLTKNSNFPLRSAFASVSACNRGSGTSAAPHDALPFFLGRPTGLPELFLGFLIPPNFGGRPDRLAGNSIAPTPEAAPAVFLGRPLGLGTPITVPPEA